MNDFVNTGHITSTADAGGAFMTAGGSPYVEGETPSVQVNAAGGPSGMTRRQYVERALNYLEAAANAADISPEQRAAYKQVIQEARDQRSYTAMRRDAGAIERSMRGKSGFSGGYARANLDSARDDLAFADANSPHAGVSVASTAPATRPGTGLTV